MVVEFSFFEIHSSLYARIFPSKFCEPYANGNVHSKHLHQSSLLRVNGFIHAMCCLNSCATFIHIMQLLYSRHVLPSFIPCNYFTHAMCCLLSRHAIYLFPLCAAFIHTMCCLHSYHANTLFHVMNSLFKPCNYFS